MVPSEPPRTEVRSPVRAGQIVDRKYRVDGVLGAGGMGIVVSATHLALDEQVALKFMTLEDGRGDSTSRARFLREAKAARKLTSAHVARVFDVGQLPTGEPYIVMELLRGHDLAKHLSTQGLLSAADTVRFMLQVCDAIKEAHAIGIIHRDLKPQNLFLTQRAAGGTVVKVLDFGIAKSLEIASGDSSLTTSQNVVGSPVYMSPEQLRASKHVDGRTDIWSLGVIMFELLSGKVPFVGDSVLELGMRIMTVPAPSLTELRAEVPAELADVVRRCLEKDPDKRFPDVESLAQALKPFVDVSHRSLPFADTLAESSSNAPFTEPDHVRTGAEFSGTKGYGTTKASTGPRVWAAAGLLGVALVGAAIAWSRQTPPAPVAHASTPAEPTAFHVDVRVTPSAATLRFDSDPPVTGQLVREVPRDGKPHTITAEADGYETVEATFRDAPPASNIVLKPARAAMATSPSTTAPAPEVAAPVATVRHEPHPKIVTPPVPTATAPASAPPPGPSATTPALPKTTNDSPIVR